MVSNVSRGAAWPADLDEVRCWYQPHLERTHEDAEVRAADLLQLQQIASGYPSRERFLTEVTLDPPRRDQRPCRTSAEGRRLPDPLNDSFGEGARMDQRVPFEWCRRLHPVGSRDRLQRRDRGRAPAALRRDDPRPRTTFTSWCRIAFSPTRRTSAATGTSMRSARVSSRARSCTCSSRPRGQRLRLERPRSRCRPRPGSISGSACTGDVADTGGMSQSQWHNLQSDHGQILRGTLVHGIASLCIDQRLDARPKPSVGQALSHANFFVSGIAT